MINPFRINNIELYTPPCTCFPVQTSRTRHSAYWFLCFIS